MTIGSRFDPLIPPELCAAPPRGVSRRTSVGARPLAFMILFLGIGLAIPGYSIVLQAFGQAVEGRVRDVYISHGSKGGEYHEVSYRYQLGGKTYSGTGRISDDRAARTKPGMPIAIRALVVGSTHVSELDMSWAEYTKSRWPVLLFPGILLLMLVFIGVSISRTKDLVRNGKPVVGKIVSRRVIKGKSTTYSVSYEFKPEYAPSTTGRTGVTKAEYDQSPEGTDVVVLYDAVNPKRNTIYAYCGYLAGNWGETIGRPGQVG